MKTSEHIARLVGRDYERVMQEIERLKVTISLQEENISEDKRIAGELDARARDLADWLRVNGATVPTSR